VRHGFPIVALVLACCGGCASFSEDEPPGPTARYGTTPTIDGVFEEGEWEDAEVVRADTVEQFRMKHDGVNLYLGVKAGGGDIRFNTKDGLRVLHWSAQLGSAEYANADTLTQTLGRPFAFELWGLRHEPPDVIQETLTRYLSDNGWVSNTASMGNLMESELAVSFDWLGVDRESGRFVEIPGVRLGGGLMISRNDPRMEDLKALSRDELKRRYPSVSWPAASTANDAVGMGTCPDTIRVDPKDYGRIWIDLEGLPAVSRS
jgi:hypothetical protein